MDGGVDYRRYAGTLVCQFARAVKEHSLQLIAVTKEILQRAEDVHVNELDGK